MDAGHHGEDDLSSSFLMLPVLWFYRMAGEEPGWWGEYIVLKDYGGCHSGGWYLNKEQLLGW